MNVQAVAPGGIGTTTGPEVAAKLPMPSCPNVLSPQTWSMPLVSMAYDALPVQLAANAGGAPWVEFVNAPWASRRIEQNQSAALGRGGEDCGGFFGSPFVRPTRARFANLAQVDAGKTRAPRALRQSFEVAIEQQALGRGLHPAHANQPEAHGQISAASALGGFARPISAPHLLKVIEPANVWTEDVYDRILRIEEHPIAQRHSLNFRRGIAGVATGFHHPVGDRADMHARAAGGDDHPIGQRRPAGEVNRDDVLGLGVFKSFNDNLR